MKRPLSQEDREWIAANNGEEVTRVITLDYQDYPKQAILRAILPTDLQELPSGYESVGHIAHYNLREEFLPYKSIIGEGSRECIGDTMMEVTCRPSDPGQAAELEDSCQQD